MRWCEMIDKSSRSYLQKLTDFFGVMTGGVVDYQVEHLLFDVLPSSQRRCPRPWMSSTARFSQTAGPVVLCGFMYLIVPVSPQKSSADTFHKRSCEGCQSAPIRRWGIVYGRPWQCSRDDHFGEVTLIFMRKDQRLQTRLQSERRPHPLHRGLRDLRRTCHLSTRPLCRSLGLGHKLRGHDILSHSLFGRYE